MQSYAIAEIAGRQFRLEEGGKVVVPRLSADEGGKVEIDKLLLVNKDGKVAVGTPYVDGAKAQAKVVDHHRSKKVRVFKKKRRKGYRREATGRQHLTTLEVESLSI